MTEKSLNPFEISFAFAKDIDFDKILIGKQLEDVLCQSLRLTDYTTKFSTLFVIFQCFAPDSNFVAAEKVTIRRKTNVIELYLLMDYNNVMKADKQTMKLLYTQTYKDAILRLLHPNDFDGNAFASDFQKAAEKYCVANV